MGLIRKSLYLGTGGVVAPNSKKHRDQMKMLAALQGAMPAEIKRAGGRYDFDGFMGQSPPSVAARADAERAARQAVPLPGGFPRPPVGSGWKLASVLLATGKPGECPRCHRQVTVAAAGKPHKAMGRKWCPGSTEFNYEYRHGHLYPVIEQQVPVSGQGDEGRGSVLGISPTVADRLAVLTRLHEQGLLTDEEYQSKRSEIINSI